MNDNFFIIMRKSDVEVHGMTDNKVDKPIRDKNTGAKERRKGLQIKEEQKVRTLRGMPGSPAAI
jgi:hypothetical protein